MAGIGNPDALIKDILSDRIFRPFVPEGAIKRHRAKKIDTNDLYFGLPAPNRRKTAIYDESHNEKAPLYI